ncbi:LsrR protein [Geomicrobium sp. JCM 19039]|nr:LsrR protein [Geomicrobium sp. JCM 19039]
MSTVDQADRFLTEPSIQEMMELAQLTKYAVVGIGGVSSEATFVQRENLTMNELAYIRKENGVGDILGQFYNQSGERLDLSLHRRLIGISIENLKTMYTIGVAGGAEKLEAIHGALRGQYLAVLVTDEETAQSLLSMGR